MNAADRRIVHKVAAENGLTTESEGFGRDRHVVLAVNYETTQQEPSNKSED